MAAMYPLGSQMLAQMDDYDDSDDSPEDEDQMEEIDELESSEHDTAAAAVAVPARAPKKPRKAPERKPGNALVPASSIQTIIEADGGAGYLALSKEGLFVMSMATEAFIKRLAQGGGRITHTQGRNTVRIQDMAETVEQYQEFFFLRDTIPMPLTLADALDRRKEKHRELVDEDPALTSPGTMAPPAHNPNPGGTSASSKSKSKSRAPNGNGLSSNGRVSGSSNKKASSSKQAQVQDVVVDGTIPSTRASSERSDSKDFVPTNPYALRAAVENGFSPQPRHSSLDQHSQHSLDAIASRVTSEEREEPIDNQDDDDVMEIDPELETRSVPSRRSSSVVSGVSSRHSASLAPADQHLHGSSNGSAGPTPQVEQNGPFTLVPDRPGRTIYSHARTE